MDEPTLYVGKAGAVKIVGIEGQITGWPEDKAARQAAAPTNWRRSRAAVARPAA
jgi:hypothetical protein